MNARHLLIGGLTLVVLAATGIVLLLVRGSGTTGADRVTTEAVPKRVCTSRPSDCGFPDSTNTGVADEAALISVPGDATSGDGWEYDDRGWISVNKPGAVVENLDIKVPIDVTANSATIQNVRIRLGGETWGMSLRHAQGTIIQGVEISAPSDEPRLLVGIKDIYGDSTGTKVSGSDISGTSTGIQITQGEIVGNYIHDLRMQEGDHVNGITSNGSSQPLSIIGNTVLNSFNQTDAIGLFQDFGIEANRIIEGNLLAGGAYTIYGGQNPGAPDAFNIVITNNRISRQYFEKGGMYGPLAAFNATARGSVWSGNVWDDSGDPILP